MTSDEQVQADGKPQRPQFGLAAVLWTTFVIGLALSYLRTIDTETVFVNAIIALVVAIVIGAVVGWCAGRIADATYWSLMITTAAYLSVAGEPAPPGFHLALATLGAASGAISGAIASSRIVLRIISAASVAGAVMIVFGVILLHGGPYLWFDLGAAPIMGGLVAVLVQLIMWVESNSNSPRYVTASWLLLAVIMVNLLVPVVI